MDKMDVVGFAAMGAVMNAIAKEATQMIEAQDMESLLALLIISEDFVKAATPLVVHHLPPQEGVAMEAIEKRILDIHGRITKQSVAIYDSAGLSEETAPL